MNEDKEKVIEDIAEDKKIIAEGEEIEAEGKKRLREDEERLRECEEKKIIVNGREKLVTEKEISFIQVVELAFGTISNPNTIYTVTYKNGEDKKPQGTMVDGDTVKIKPGMIFNVTATDKS